MRVMLSSLRYPLALLTILALAAPGCQKEKDKNDKPDDKPTPTAEDKPSDSPGIESKDIMDRTEVAKETHVKHVLIGWKDLAAAYRGRMDPRAKERTEAEATKLATEIAGKLRADPKLLDELIKKHSEDPGSLSGDPYVVTADAQFVPSFKNLGLRLKLNEVGIARTTYGYHVMMRITPPPPDPLESAEILAREAKTSEARVQHVLIGWKDVPAAKQRPLDPRAAERTKADADKLAKTVLDKVKAGEDMAALMKEYSEDPGSKDNGKIYDVSPRAPMVDSFKKLSLRLDVDEAGMVISPFGWHVIKRVAPPPPDPLESGEILARKPVTEKSKVKHILLGWTEANTGDERGKKRTRAELDKLVKETVASLRKGDPIEPLMAKLSEDPGSAKTGNSYDASPNAALVPPFKALSLRLKKDEVGVVKTRFGIHIIKRVE